MGRNAQDRKLGDLGIRAVSGSIYVVIFVTCLLISPLSTAIVVAAFAGICTFEYVRMANGGVSLSDWLVVAAGAAIPLLVYFFGALAGLNMLVAVAIVLLSWHVFDQGMGTEKVGASILALVYCSLMFSTLVLIRQLPADALGTILALAVAISVWVADIFAYLIGSKFGKHKMMPRISPKKSWEGFFGGLLGSVLVWLVFALIDSSLGIPLAIIIGLVCGIFDVLGDLIESRIKRVYGVKDSGKIMPGHGGLLDRNDSLIFVSAICFIVCRIGGML